MMHFIPLPLLPWDRLGCERNNIRNKSWHQWTFTETQDDLDFCHTTMETSKAKARTLPEMLEK